MKNTTHYATPEEIGRTIKTYFLSHGITQDEVAERLKTSQPNISSKLSGARPFASNSARKWHEAFGFNKTYLIAGVGTLIDEDNEIPSINQTITNNQGVAVQQAGAHNTSSIDEKSKDERFFAKLCGELMQKIMERDVRICCLEKHIKELEDGKRQ